MPGGLLAGRCGGLKYVAAWEVWESIVAAGWYPNSVRASA